MKGQNMPSGSDGPETRVPIERLSDVVTEAVDIVDRPDIERGFIVIKRNQEETIMAGKKGEGNPESVAAPEPVVVQKNVDVAADAEKESEKVKEKETVVVEKNADGMAEIKGQIAENNVKISELTGVMSEMVGLMKSAAEKSAPVVEKVIEPVVVEKTAPVDVAAVALDAQKKTVDAYEALTRRIAAIEKAAGISKAAPDDVTEGDGDGDEDGEFWHGTNMSGFIRT